MSSFASSSELETSSIGSSSVSEPEQAYNGGEHSENLAYPQVESEILGRIMTASNLEYEPTREVDEEEVIVRDDRVSHISVATDQSNSLVRTKTRFFSPKLREERKMVLRRFLLVNFSLICFILIAFSLFWGNTYNASHFYYKVNILAVLQDDIVDINSSVIPFISVLPSLVEEQEATWHVYNTSQFEKKFNVHGTEEINAEVLKLIYDELYFMSLNVQPNVTQILYNSLAQENSSLVFNSTELFEVSYESSRDLISLKPWMYPIMTAFETSVASYYTQEYLPQFLRNISSEVPIETINPLKLSYATSLSFNANDYRPFTDRLLMCTTIIGAIYTLILTVFQYLIYGPIHAQMAQVLKPKYITVYRCCITWGTCFLLSLFISTVSAIYQVDFTPTFGKGGFVIFWMSTWLFMLSVAGANENVISMIFLYDPPFLGFWVLGFVILNLGPSFFSMALDSNFYRYGYAMPLHNIIDIYRVIFFDVSKSKMGRNYGVLVAWVALNTALAEVVLRWVSRTVAKREKAAAEATQNASSDNDIKE
ncbi:hypothetical protein KAFR_0C06263 [Kazachstania africana CBS 2517]|uniref:DUF3533 domain-containing protein n=1 Tax=Kazachstania africana (strain ATCC 22294 / BCRC 22015 / CBS 2517 / CECT 1963 / NBRC 1671 / NRRL Y-8276) TaxID=1071382 RepID=H2ATC2_KAZAF|nr:hypothetical protein KAFR_0C06263 [Kazachstania africana CBS 2517]CCF57622.1 hypothetical protein KAFR_0C06263 [Kazachstania africana CBS 2517]